MHPSGVEQCLKLYYSMEAFLGALKTSVQVIIKNERSGVVLLV